MSKDRLWRIKLHARLHDPAEKALVLLRDPAGHEGGTSRALRRLIGAVDATAAASIENDDGEVLHAAAFGEGIDAHSYRLVQRADWWAASADRPQWPMEEVKLQRPGGEVKTFGAASFAQVRWTQQPQLVHPLTGKVFDLKGAAGGLDDTGFHDIMQRSLAHFRRLLVRDDAGGIDHRR